jgi:hypothetical protein
MRTPHHDATRGSRMAENDELGEINLWRRNAASPRSTGAEAL